MPDREKVVRGLEHCVGEEHANCENCPYLMDVVGVGCYTRLNRDALALLREQEAKAAWYDSNDLLRYWHCGHCGVIITHGDKYCRMCGREVKWEPPKEDKDAE